MPSCTTAPANAAGRSLPYEFSGHYACVAVVRPVRGRPVDQHHYAVAEIDQEVDTRAHPDDPGDEAGKLEGPHLGHRGGPADGGELPVVPITERPRLFALYRQNDVLGGMVPHLLRGGRDAGHGALALHPGEVAGDEDLRMAPPRQVRLDLHPPGPGKRRAERAAEPPAGDA